MCDDPGLLAARIYRGRGIDAVHAASVAVVSETGALSHAYGNPTQRFSLRSATKPFQALPLVTTGALGALGLGDPELALACASHSGSDRHVAVVLDMLARAGASVEALKCGAHWPIGLRLRGEWPVHGEDRNPLRHNCSGKHAGFLLLSRHLGQPLAAYLEPDGVVQSAVRAAVAAACEVSSDALAVAVDGCSAPTFSFPLTALAVGFKNLALGRAAALGGTLARVRDAMQAEPLLVSGEGRFDDDLARSFPGNVVCKGGAEAMQGIGFRDPPLGIAVKIHDGGERALAPVCVAVLRELGIVNDLARFPLLARHERPPIFNHSRIRTGEIVAELSLRR